MPWPSRCLPPSGGIPPVVRRVSGLGSRSSNIARLHQGRRESLSAPTPLLYSGGRVARELPCFTKRKAPPKRGSHRQNRRSYFLASIIEETSMVFFSVSALPFTVTSLPAIFAASAWLDSTHIDLSEGL